MMVRISAIALTEEQKRILADFSQSGSAQHIHRAQLILAYGEGMPTMQAALKAGISRGRARFWKRQFLSKGMKIFEVETHPSIPNMEVEQKIDTGLAMPSEILDSAISSPEPVPPAKEVPYPEVQKSMGMKLEDTLAEAGKKVWLYHFAIMLSHEQGTFLGEDIEELHDMRVATRRMRTAFEIFGEAFEPKLMDRYMNSLRKVGQALGEVRDMDVILEKGIHYQQKVPEQKRLGLEPLLNSWRVDIDRKRNKLNKLLQSDKYIKFKIEFNNFLQVQAKGKDTDIPGIEATSYVRDIVPVLVYNRYAKVRAFDGILPSATVSQLHALRIEFKKFRYTLEYFREILGNHAGVIINEIKQYQDHLGELHDADVTCQLVNNFLEGWEENQTNTPIPARVNPEGIVTYLASLYAERYRLMIKFPELWKKFNRPEFRQKMAQAIATL